MKSNIKPSWFDNPNVRTLQKGDIFKFNGSTKKWLFIGYNTDKKGYEYTSIDNPNKIGILKQTYKDSVILK